MTRDLATEGPVPGQQAMPVGMRHLSLFSGYGGIDRALEEVLGAETVAVADIDKGACKILAHRYPHVPNLGDITQVDWTEWAGKVDIISGGSPCQDLSSAGRRRGMTEGTRSNLWVAMRTAIETIKPALVVWENVRGAFSATATSDLESCPGCVGETGNGKPHLRALGRVLGDLSDLGHDTWWYGLRASDVGAAHHRFRVFVIAVNRDSDADIIGRGREWRFGAVQRDTDGPGGANAVRGRGESAPLVALPTPTADRDGNTPETHLARKPGRKVVTSLDVVVNHMLPSPRTSDTNGAGRHGTGGPDLRTVVAAIPTPRATDGTKGGPNQRGSSGDLILPSSVQDWREYEPAIRRQEQAFGYPAPLPTEPTQTSRRKCSVHGNSQERRPGEELRNVRNPADAEEIRKRATGRPERFSSEASLLPELRQHEDGDHQIWPRLQSETPSQGNMRNVRGETLFEREEVARSPQGQGLGQRQPSELDDAMRLVPPEAPLERGQGAAGGSDQGSNCTCNHRLSAEFSSWLMGLEPGWITDVPGITRNEALKAAGNGVVPQQCAAALRRFLHDYQETA